MAATVPPGGGGFAFARGLVSLALAGLGATLTLAALVLAFVLISSAVASAAGDIDPAPDEPETPVAPPVPTDPRLGEVPLPAENGWTASLALDNQRVGVWSVRVAQVFDEFGTPEIIGADDRGRIQILVSYSGKWTPRATVHDGLWLGGLAYGWVDPRFPRGEIYTGGLMGNLYQVVTHSQGMVDSRLIAQLPGREINVILTGDLDPRTEGQELLVFTKPGGLYRVTPTGPHGTFETTFLMPIRGRVRDAVVLPPRKDRATQIATVARDGVFGVLSMEKDGPKWIYTRRLPMGRGRIALRPGGENDPIVLFTTLDDGRVLRHERLKTGWKTATIYAGPQGLRGIAAGRFHEDPDAESVAVYGYSGKVQLITKTKDGWKAETIFRAVDKGHWVTRGELDGRNGTDEIVVSGFGGRVILLSRPAGFALPGVTTDPDDIPPELEPEPEKVEKPERVEPPAKLEEKDSGS